MIDELTNISKIDITHEHLVDVTECSIQRPKVQEIQREYYSEKKEKTYNKNTTIDIDKLVL